jgi:hypothetical protein
MRSYGSKLGAGYEEKLADIHLEKISTMQSVDGPPPSIDMELYGKEVEGAEVIAGTFGSLCLGSLIPKVEYGSSVCEENGQTWEVETLKALYRCDHSVFGRGLPTDEA